MLFRINLFIIICFSRDILTLNSVRGEEVEGVNKSMIEVSVWDDIRGLDHKPDLNISHQFEKVLKKFDRRVKLNYLKESMDRETVCCALGQIAADKGYHCHVMFYGIDILQRNTNRAHNKKLAFYGRDKVPHFGYKLMNRFDKCLHKSSHTFNQCCHLATKLKNT